MSGNAEAFQWLTNNSQIFDGKLKRKKKKTLIQILVTLNSTITNTQEKLLFELIR